MSQMSSFDRLMARSINQKADEPDWGAWTQADPGQTGPNDTRSLGEFVGDTALAIPEGLAHTADAVTSALGNKSNNYITNWVQGFESNKLRAQLAQEQQAAAAQSAQDEATGASPFTRLAHSVGNFLQAPVHNIGTGIGEYAPAAMAGEAALPAMIATGALQGNKEALDRGDTGQKRVMDVITSALTAGAMHKLGDSSALVSDYINKYLSDGLVNKLEAKAAAAHPGEAPPDVSLPKIPSRPELHDLSEAPVPPANPNEPLSSFPQTPAGDAQAALDMRQRQMTYDEDLARYKEQRKLFDLKKEQNDYAAQEHNADVDNIIKKYGDTKAANDSQLAEYAKKLDSYNSTRQELGLNDPASLSEQMAQAARENNLAKYMAAHAAAQFGVNGIGGGAIAALGAAANGDNPEDAFGQGIGTGLAFGTLHGVSPMARLAAGSAIDKAKSSAASVSEKVQAAKNLLKKEKTKTPMGDADNSSSSNDNTEATTAKASENQAEGQPEEQTSNAAQSDEPKIAQPGPHDDLSDEGKQQFAKVLAQRGLNEDQINSILNEVQNSANDPNHTASKLAQQSSTVMEKGEDNEPKLRDDVDDNDIRTYMDTLLGSYNGGHATAAIKNLPDDMSSEDKEALGKFAANKLAGLHAHNSTGNIGSLMRDISPEQFDKLSPAQQLFITNNMGREDLKPKGTPEDVNADVDRILFKRAASTPEEVEQRNNYLEGMAHHFNNIANIKDSGLSNGIKKTLYDSVSGKTYEGNDGRLQYKPGSGDLVRGQLEAHTNDNKDASEAIVRHAIDRVQTPLDFLSHSQHGEVKNGSIREPSNFRADQDGQVNYTKQPNRFYDRKIKGKFNDSFNKGLIEEARLKRATAQRLAAEHERKYGEKINVPGLDFSFLKDKNLRDYAEKRMQEPVKGVHTGSSINGRDGLGDLPVNGSSTKGNYTVPKGSDGSGSTGSKSEKPGGGDSSTGGSESGTGSDGNQHVTEVKSVKDFDHGLEQALREGHDFRFTGSNEYRKAVIQRARQYGFTENGDVLHNPLKPKSGSYTMASTSNAEVAKLKAEIAKDNSPNFVATKASKYGQGNHAKVEKLLKENGYSKMGDGLSHLWKKEGEHSQNFLRNLASLKMQVSTSNVFLSGSRALKELPESVRNAIAALKDKGYRFLVGDADGADKAFQQELDANSAHIHHLYDVNNTIEGAKHTRVTYPKGMDFADRQRLRDKVMADKSGSGVAYWDGQSTGTLRNIYNLAKEGKPVLVFDKDGAHTIISSDSDLHRFYSRLPPSVKKSADAFMHFDVGSSNAAKFFERTQLGNGLVHEPAITRAMQNYAKPTEVHEEFVKAVDKEKARTVFTHVKRLFNEVVSPALDKAIDVLESGKHGSKYEKQQFASVKNLLGDDGKIDPKLKQIGLTAVMDTLFNGVHDFNHVDDVISGKQIRLATDTASRQALQTALRLLNAKKESDVQPAHVEAPLAQMINGIFDSLVKSEDIKKTYETEIIKDKYGKDHEIQVPYFSKFSPLDEVSAQGDIPKYWLSNMAAMSTKDMTKTHSIGEPLPIRAPVGASKMQISAMKAENNRLYKPVGHFISLLDKLGENWGFAFEPESTGYLPGYEKVRTAIRNVRNNAVKFITPLADEDGLYFNTHIVGNGRYMYEGGLNPQANKTIRFSLSPFSRKVEWSDRNDINTADPHWRLALAQALGIKIERQSMEKSLEQLPERLEQHKDLIDTLKGLSEEEVSPAEVADKIRSAGVDEHAIAALNEYHTIRDYPGTESHLPIEVDGITNGPAGGLGIFGDYKTKEGRELMAKAGIYIKEPGDEVPQNQQSIKENPDLYVSALEQMPNASDILGKNEKEQAISDLLKDLGWLKDDDKFSRNFLKQPVQQSTYLSSDVGIANTIQRDVLKAALDQVDQGKLSASVLKTLGIKIDGKDFIWRPVVDMPDEMKYADPFYRLGKETREAVSHVYPSEVDHKVRTMGFAGWFRAAAAHAEMEKALKKTKYPTYGDLDKIQKIYTDAAPKLASISSGSLYAPESPERVTRNYYGSLPMGLPKRDATNYHVEHMMPNIYDSNGLVNKGFAVGQIQNISDGHAVTRADSNGDLTHGFEVYDGLFIDPSKAHNLAQKLNSYFAENLQVNPFEEHIEPIKKLLNSMSQKEFVAASKQWSPTYKPLFETPQDLLDAVTGYSEAQKERINDLANKDVVVEQYSAGSTDSGEQSSQHIQTKFATQQNLTTKAIKTLKDRVIAGRSVKENPIGHSIARLIDHNKDYLKNINIHQVTPEEVPAIARRYGLSEDIIKTISESHGAYDPAANGGNGVIFAINRGSAREQNRSLLHELTHAMITKKLNSLPFDHPDVQALADARDQVLAMKLEKSDPANRSLNTLREIEASDLSPSQKLNEFAATFIESPELIKAAMSEKPKYSKFTKMLNKIKDFLFGAKGSLADHTFKAIANLSGSGEEATKTFATDKNGQGLLLKRDNSDTQSRIWDDIHGDDEVAENLRKAQTQTQDAVKTAEAYTALNDLKNQGWTFTPQQEQLFLVNRYRASGKDAETLKYLRDLAPKASEILSKEGTLSLGDESVKNLLALAQTHPENFKDYKFPSLMNRDRGLAEYAAGYSANTNAWDHSQLLEAMNKAGGATRYADRKVAEVIGNGADKLVRKLTNDKYSASDFTKTWDNHVPEYVNSSKIPNTLRDIFKYIAPVMDKEIPILGSIRQFSYALDKARQNARSKLPAALKKLFKTKLSKAEEKALFHTAKSDIAKYDNWKDIIRNSTDEPVAPKMSKAAKQAADDLAYHMATGKAVHDLHGNADIIAHRFGGKAEAIDRYIGEKAYTQLPEDIKQTMADLLSREEDAVSSTLGYHQELKERNTRYGGNAGKFNSLKGYMPNEMKDTSMNLAAVEPGSDEHNYLKKLGYTEIGKLARNAGEDGKPLVVMTGRHGGNIASNQGGLARIKYTIGGYNSETRTVSRFSLGHVNGNFAHMRSGGKLRPVFTADGKVLHYERQFDLPDKLSFSTHDDVFHSLGAYEGNLTEMSLRNTINQAQLNKLKDYYEANSDKGGFVNIATSKDPIIRQAFKALPRTFHEQAEATFGKKNFVPVSRSLVNDFLGYKKASVGDFWTGETRWSPKVQKAVTQVAHAILGEKAYQHLMNMENIIEEGTHYAQRMIAVASIRIPLRNMCTDILQLMSQGIPMGTILKRGTAIAKDLKAYNQSQQEIFNLKAAMARQDISPALRENYEKRIQIEEDRISGLSVHKLIKAGMYSVVDDGLVPNHQSNGMITPYIEAAMDKLPPGFDTVARNLFATQDSHLFRAVQQGVETTDFIARALTYENNVAKLGHEAAVQKAMNAFVDFGRAKGRTRDKLESLGGMWFWNSKLKSMAVAGQMFRDNPLLSILYNHVPFDTHIGFLNNLTTPLTDNVLTQAADGKIGFSLGWSPLGSAWQMNPFVELMH